MGMRSVIDHVRNDDIRERLKVENITDRCRKPIMLWFEHVKRRDQDYAGRKTLEMGEKEEYQSKDVWTVSTET